MAWHCCNLHQGLVLNFTIKGVLWPLAEKEPSFHLAPEFLYLSQAGGKPTLSGPKSPPALPALPTGGTDGSNPCTGSLLHVESPPGGGCNHKQHFAHLPAVPCALLLCRNYSPYCLASQLGSPGKNRTLGVSWVFLAMGPFFVIPSSPGPARC